MTLRTRRRAALHRRRFDPVDAVHAAASLFTDALHAEAAISGLSALTDDPAALARGLEQRGDREALGALRAIAWTHRCPVASAAADRLAATGVRAPGWASGLGDYVARGALSGREDGRDALFVAFAGRPEHVLAAFTDPAGAQLFLTEPGLDGLRDEWRRRGWTLVPCPLAVAAERLEAALGETTLDGPVALDIRLLAMRRLERLRGRPA